MGRWTREARCCHKEKLIDTQGKYLLKGGNTNAVIIFFGGGAVVCVYSNSNKERAGVKKIEINNREREWREEAGW